MALALILAVTLIAVALRRTRWAEPALRVSRMAYAIFLVFALLYFPARAGFHVAPPACEWKFDLALAAHSLTNYPHMILFALFFMLTYAQLPRVPGAFIWSAAACMAMGLLVELAQGATGQGNCEILDLIPDAVGALIGALIILLGTRVTRSKG